MHSSLNRSNTTVNPSNTTVSTTYMNNREKEKYIEEFSFPFCDEASKYERVSKIGQGTFGYEFMFLLKYVPFHSYFTLNTIIKEKPIVLLLLSSSSY